MSRNKTNLLHYFCSGVVTKLDCSSVRASMRTMSLSKCLAYLFLFDDEILRVMQGHMLILNAIGVFCVSTLSH